MGLADDRKPVNLMTVHVSTSVTVHEVSNRKHSKIKFTTGHESGLRLSRYLLWSVYIYIPICAQISWDYESANTPSPHLFVG